MKNVYIKVPLLQAIIYIPIYVKIVWELCLKKLGRNKREPQTIQFIGKLADLMSQQIFIEKYVDLGHPISLVHINGVLVLNTLIDSGGKINIITNKTMEQLQLLNLRPTPNILKLID